MMQFRNKPALLAAGLLAGSMLLPEGSAHADKMEHPESTTLSGSYLAGRLAGQLRDSDAASVYFREALKDDPNNLTLLDRGFTTTLIAGHHDEAMELAKRLVEADSSHASARLALGVKAMRSRQYAQAKAQFIEIGRSPWSELISTVLIGWAQHGAGEKADAIQTVSALEGQDWYESFKAFHLGLLAEQSGLSEEAGKFYDTAYVASDKGALRVIEAYARHLIRVGMNDEAGKVIASYWKIVPDHPTLLRLEDDIKEGRVPPPLVAGPAEGAAEVLYGLGKALSTSKGEDVAAIYLQLALYLRPEFGEAAISLADFYEIVDDHENAIKSYEMVPADNPLRPEAEILKALNLNDLDRRDEAIAELQALVEAEPRKESAIKALGNLLRYDAKFKEAAEVYTKAVTLIGVPTRQDWLLFYFRGIAYERSKQWPKAEADLEKALELNPDQPDVLNYLGYSWVDQGIHLEKALDMIRKAVDLRSRDGYIIDSLGWAYYRLGRYEEAAVQLERAVERQPDDPIINDHLGDAYWRAGRRLEAKFQWRHARDLKPTAELLETILLKIENGLGTRSTIARPRKKPPRMTTADRAPIEEFAPAKINLALHVTGRRDDGCHLIDTIAAFADAGDTIQVMDADDIELAVAGSHAGGLEGGNNLVVRAAKLLRDATGIRTGARLLLEKSLPIAAGIGGGSSDAAAAMRALNRHWNLGLSGVELATLGILLGADLPMCLAARALRARGIGEEIMLLEGWPVFHLVLANPGKAQETAGVFGAYAVMDCSETGPLSEPPAEDRAGWLAREGRNDLQVPAIALLPEIETVLEALRDGKPDAFVRMSGSGATCFRVCADAEAAQRLANAVSASNPDWWVRAVRAQ